MDWIHALMQHEFQLRPKTPAPENESPYHLHMGSHPVLISASHSTYHMRNGRRKHAEGFTSGFAQLIAEHSGAFAFYPRFLQVEDPNFSAESAYKTELARIVNEHDIRFILDIHGCTDRHHIGLALGTINGRSCPTIEPILSAQFVAHGWTQLSPTEVAGLSELHQYHFVVNLPKFAGGVRQHTTTRFAVDSLGIEAAQLEVCSNLRVPLVRWGKNWFEGDRQA
ncbi:MAG: hypothetical protein ACPG8W_13820, partial [Candidatus Promineifilaceae bacterium]